MIQSPLVRRLGLLVAIFAAYVVAGKLGLRLAYVNPSATPVWPPTGIALAAFLLAGYDVWPAILLGAFVVNITTAGSAATSVGIAAGNMLEGLVGAYLVNRFARGRRACERARDVFKLAGLAAFASTTLSATAGVVSLSLDGFARWSDFGTIWSTWWTGDAVGDLVVAPLVLLWTANPRVHWTRRQTLEAAALLVCLLVVGLAAFDGVFPWKDRHYPLEFLCVPLMLWAAFRFEQREAAVVVVLLSGLAIWGTLRGWGPFARPAFNESLLLLQAFEGVSAIMTLVLAAAVAERKEAEERLRRLAVSDPLTGLANYRQLVLALDGEIRRSSRTERPFAVVLLDLDGLKKINDHYGHLVGSLALRRVAETLLGSCRGIDTAARFGGDEFALVLPETGDAAAWHVARRVAERVARDGEKPLLSVSIGVAVHPRDGASLEALLNAADRSLYDAKARRPSSPNRPPRAAR
jgi:diguanylate cyclase (GGDEF)-like protein